MIAKFSEWLKWVIIGIDLVKWTWFGINSCLGLGQGDLIFVVDMDLGCVGHFCNWVDNLMTSGLASLWAHVWWFKAFYSGCVVVLGVDLVFGLINYVLKYK